MIRSIDAIGEDEGSRSDAQQQVGNEAKQRLSLKSSR